MTVLYYVSAYIQHNGDISLEKKSDIRSVQFGVKEKSITYIHVYIYIYIYIYTHTYIHIYHVSFYMSLTNLEQDPRDNNSVTQFCSSDAGRFTTQHHTQFYNVFLQYLIPPVI